MITSLILFFGALVLALALTPVSKWLAPHAGVIARPRSRDVHTIPVPKMGGVAILLAVMAMVVLLRGQPEIRQIVSIIFGAAFMSFLGLVDDRFGLSAYVRLPLQLATAAFVWFNGVRIQFFLIEYLDAALTVIWIVGITNAMNFLDNMDGLLAGISAVISAFFLVLAVFNGQILVGALSAAMLGACIGFLFYNLNPATVFMGDSGSMFLGFLLACIAIKLRFAQTPSVSWLVPLVVMGLPVFDMTLVVISRLRRGKNPLTTPGKDHSSHRLTALGFSHREAVMILYLVCCALGVAALLVSAFDRTAALLLGLAILFAGVFMLWFMEFGPWKFTNPYPLPGAKPESPAEQTNA
ncbi:MAG TPA: MraY family glycosyltransferase [Thermoflexales bacterium]|nr:MraY family glycosyltransferase [Thermoflexales bacterium]HQW35152.1 MraY family glycosyltransferase [Thermoflexales bacterium]HQX74874.1 MraY family glycosyltransferase [Thermoflexales bacterium]HQZ21751.1 MraY family glycosyltransferase [Thermoflexales bacterium]HQZ99555.1 MraY family glycosyltransferase [Thermoflexales bacterium]